MKNIDILAIGDVVTDAFIRLNDAEATCDVDKKNCKLCVRFGDKVPYESVEICTSVGNSANASVAAARLGLSAYLLAYVGNDQNGQECIAELQKNNVYTDYVRVEEGKKTNYHYVLWYDVERTILVKHESFTYNLGEIEAPKWVYLSSLGENTLDYHNQIADFVEKNPETKMAFQPGTFQIKMGKDVLNRIYKNTDIFFCNVEEAQKILNESSREIKTLMKGLSALGPKKVVITDGYDGAYAHDTESPEDFWFMPIYPHAAFERTGAGDAFASTVVSTLALGKSLVEALIWAPINAMSVVQQVGAQKGLLTLEQLENYLSQAPENYKVSKI